MAGSKFVVLGGYGIIGEVVVLDLFRRCKDCEIVIAGRNLSKAKKYADSFKSKRVRAVELNISDVKSTAILLKGADVVVNCLQYYFNIEVMNACLKAKTNYVDLGGLFHLTKKQLRLNNKFAKIDKIAIIGCGSTPGITNVMAAYGGKFLDNVKSIDMTFADRNYLEYKRKFVLPYSFKTILDEFMKSPAVLKNGKLIFVKAGEGEKIYDFGKEYGMIKGVYSLHSELATLPEFFKKKGIKSCEFRTTFDEDFRNKINSLIETGLVSEETIEINGEEPKISDVTGKIMNRLTMKEGDKVEDKEILRVNFNNNQLIMDAVAKSTSGISAGVWDTAVPCSIISQMIAFGKIKKRGVFAPEKVVEPIEFFEELAKRKIVILKNGIIS